MFKHISNFENISYDRISNQCTFNEHVSNVCARANRFLGLMKKVFVSRNKSVLLPVYKSHVRSILEFGSILWHPYRICLSQLVENVQRRFSRLFPHLRHVSYRNRLSDLNLHSLHARRLRYELIFIYKILNGLVDIDPSAFFVYSSSSSLRRHSLKLIPPSSSKDYRRYFFTVDSVFHWNRMSDSEVQVSSVSQFKKSVISYFSRCDIW